MEYQLTTNRFRKYNDKMQTSLSLKRDLRCRTPTIFCEPPLQPNRNIMATHQRHLNPEKTNIVPTFRFSYLQKEPQSEKLMHRTEPVHRSEIIHMTQSKNQDIEIAFIAPIKESQCEPIHMKQYKNQTRERVFSIPKNIQSDRVSQRTEHKHQIQSKNQPRERAVSTPKQNASFCMSQYSPNLRKRKAHFLTVVSRLPSMSKNKKINFL